jgi:hypothetical protein
MPQYNIIVLEYGICENTTVYMCKLKASLLIADYLANLSTFPIPHTHTHTLASTLPFP